MGQADFCIADLTYARPSVYYEAGYLTGSDKPVIFVARSDHFRARDSDPEGNLRVHFDLQMKNIIAWNAPNKTFQRRLSKRISLVLRLLAKRQKLEERQTVEQHSTAAQQNAFSNLSINDKAKQIREAALPIIRRHAFGKAKKAGRHGRLPFERRNGRSLDELHFLVPTSLSDGLRDARSLIWLAEEWKRREPTRNVSRLTLTIVLAPLSAVRTKTIASAFPHYTPVTPTLFRHEDTVTIYADKSRGFELHKPRTVPSTTNIAVLPQVENVERMRSALTDLLSTLRQKQGRS
jgi:hypothetical protein